MTLIEIRSGDRGELIGVAEIDSGPLGERVLFPYYKDDYTISTISVPVRAFMSYTHQDIYPVLKTDRKTIRKINKLCCWGIDEGYLTVVDEIKSYLKR